MEPKYKIGDIVTIKKKREGAEINYRFCFTDTMVRDYGGKSYKIKSISSVSLFLKCEISNRIPLLS